MGDDKVVRRIPSEVLNGAISKLDEVINMLDPYLVALTPPEREALVKIEGESVKFVEMSHELAVENPELFPNFMHVELFREEYFTIQELRTFENKLNQLKDNVTDTEMTAESNVLDTALAFYHTVKIAARCDIPGAREIYEELKLRLPVRRRKKLRGQIAS